MKNILKSFFCLAIIISLASCGSEDVIKLEGTWTAVEFSATISKSSTISEQKTTEIKGSNLNYDLTLDGSSFITSGSYLLTTTSTTTGTAPVTVTETYSNIIGTGTYSAKETVMTKHKSFFNFIFFGASFANSIQPLTSNYEINAVGELIISQNENISIATPDGFSPVLIVSSSKWVKK